MSPESIERIKRLVVLIPYVAKHPDGVPVAKVLDFAGYQSKETFYADLELLRMIGVPPCAPDDLIDIEVESEKVYVTLTQGFKRPPRLTAVEAAALLAVAEPLGKATGQTLESAVQKLKGALPPGSVESLDELVRSAAVESAPPPKWHAQLREAIAKRVEVVVDYWAASEGKAESRTLEPRKVFLHKSHWYLAAWNPAKGAEHLYRLDRMREVRLGTRGVGERTAGQEGDYDREVLFIGAEAHPEVEVRFEPSVARLAMEQWGPLAKKNADGSVTVVTRMAGEAYAVSWAMGYGGMVSFTKPAELQRSLERRASDMLRAYTGRPSSAPHEPNGANPSVPPRNPNST